jgi:hypothetical protein
MRSDIVEKTAAGSNFPPRTVHIRTHRISAELNATETLFRGTELRLIYELVSSENLSGLEV